MLKFVNIEAKEIVPAFFRSCFNRVGHRARGGRPPPPSSSQAPVPQPTSLAKPASAPAHPRPVSPKCTPAGTNPTELHALEQRLQYFSDKVRGRTKLHWHRYGRVDQSD